jgi:ABC-type oligopeptide transport system substrate-binding subunit
MKGGLSMRSGKRAMLIALVIVALLAAALLAASCGGGKTSTKTTTPKLTNNEQVNEYLEQLDSQMNSVNENDLSDGQLNNQNLGL